ncbi:hypothetical protein FHS57_002083 [Runella defluvii]|uniref:Uncharacterized protein n=1 Tax=Runella defluvii TaxID=370973 RepID=A0A7W6EQ29_9BACT|nr:hypothetical protein [Runella defluvii]
MNLIAKFQFVFFICYGKIPIFNTVFFPKKKGVLLVNVLDFYL